MIGNKRRLASLNAIYLLFLRSTCAHTALANHFTRNDDLETPIDVDAPSNVLFARDSSTINAGLEEPRFISRDVDDGAQDDGSANYQQALDDLKLGYDVSEKEADLHAHDFYNFKTRPDLQAPRWNVTIHKPGHVAPGYWFTAPYEDVFQRNPQPSWNGPHIYDSYGELIWSGAHLCERSDAFDFRIQRYRGKNRLVFMYRHDQTAVILDDSYRILQKVSIAPGILGYNAHDLNMIDNGNSVLSLYKHRGEATIEESRSIGFKGGKCEVGFDGFRLRDASTPDWKILFDWNSHGHIGLNESTHLDSDNKCNHGWDYVHLNSVDRCPDGDYLLSSRHADALYKISHKDGSIKYRIGGVNSDFEGNFVFSRQHHIRCREQNQTHLIVSMMDNARGSRTESGSNPFSRGLVVALDLASNKYPKPMHVIAEYPHPDLDFANSRGSLQYLDNGNVFLSWALKAEVSEHLADGSVVSQARMWDEALSSYRAYKYDFVGHPVEIPAVYAEQVYDPNVRDSKGKLKPVTRVYVSWNGATEVDHWSFNRTSSTGKHGKRMATASRSGFETMIQYNDTISTGYLIVDAWDKKGRALSGGASKVVRVSVPSNWEFDSSEEDNDRSFLSSSWLPSVDLVLAFVVGVLMTVFLSSLFNGTVRNIWNSSTGRPWWKGQSYHVVGNGNTSEAWVVRGGEERDSSDYEEVKSP